MFVENVRLYLCRVTLEPIEAQRMDFAATDLQQINLKYKCTGNIINKPIWILLPIPKIKSTLGWAVFTNTISTPSFFRNHVVH